MGDPNDNLYFDKPGHYASDVPGMNYDAHLAGPCDNFQIYTFGRGPGGEPLQCHWIPNQWPPVYTGFWVASPQLHGVQEIGAPCPRRKRRHRLPTDAHCCAWVTRAGRPGSSPATGSSRHSRDV